MNLPTCLVVCSCVPKGVRVCPFIGQISSLPHNRSLFPNPKFRRDAVVTAAGGKEEGGRNTQYSKGAPRPPLSDPFLRAFPHFPERHRHHIINTVFSFRPLSLSRPSQGTRWQDCRPIPPRDGPWRRRRWRLRPKPSSPLGHFSSQSRICCRGGR